MKKNKKNQQGFTVASVALLALAFLFVMTATKGPYWGKTDVQDSVVMISEEEEQVSLEETESDETLTGMTIVRRQIHSLYKEGQKVPVTSCTVSEYVISGGEKIPKAETCKVEYVETEKEEQKEPYR